VINIAYYNKKDKFYTCRMGLDAILSFTRRHIYS